MGSLAGYDPQQVGPESESLKEPASGHHHKPTQMNGDHTAATTKPDSSATPKIHYFSPPNSTTIGAVLTLIFYHMLPFTALPHLALMYLGYSLYHRSLLAFSSYIGFLLLLVVVPLYYSRNIRRSVRPLYEALATYLPSARYIVPEEAVPAGKAYIFAIHPHGRMFYANALFSQLHEIWRVPMKLATGDVFQTAAGGFFQVPFARNWFALIGIMPADKHRIIAKLRNKDHVTIAVGGVREVCLGTQDDADLLYLKRRKGFLQIAMDEGAGVVPVYAFNENQLFKHDPRGVLDFWAWVNKHVKVGVPFMRGYYNLPMPYRKDLLLVFGNPVFANEGETIEEFHERYIETVIKLFEEYVRLSPDPNHKLIIK